MLRLAILAALLINGPVMARNTDSRPQGKAKVTTPTVQNNAEAEEADQERLLDMAERGEITLDQAVTTFRRKWGYPELPGEPGSLNFSPGPVLPQKK